MKILSQETIDEFRLGPCEWCSSPFLTDPHHLWAKGMGNAYQLDVRINLIAMCRVCHTVYHNGGIHRQALLVIVAGREGRTVEDIEEEILLLRRLPKGTDHERAVSDYWAGQAGGLRHDRERQGQGDRYRLYPPAHRRRRLGLPRLETNQGRQGWQPF